MDTVAMLRLAPHLARALWRVRRGLKIAMSFDIADFCTLECPYCYWLESTQHQQLSAEEIFAIMRKAVREDGIVHGTLVGGEPTLRPDVIMGAAKIIPIVWVVTNGMKVRKSMAGPEYADWDLGDLPANVWPILSLDGVGEAHDTSRAHKGLYEELRSRFFRTVLARRTLATTTLHKGNANQPAKLLEAWKDSGIRGMTFEFATPIGRRPNPQTDLVGAERDAVIDVLVTLKREYGGFMRNSVAGLNMQRSANLSSWVGAKNCPTARLTVAFDSLGRVKSPCVLGSNPENRMGKRPNCSACGCHVPTVLNGMRRIDLETIQAAFWFLD